MKLAVTSLGAWAGFETEFGNLGRTAEELLEACEDRFVGRCDTSQNVPARRLLVPRLQPDATLCPRQSFGAIRTTIREHDMNRWLQLPECRSSQAAA